MAFNVTQCPVCDSTFNTNARILESAAGRVRCGACLTVFEAAQNYIEANDSDSDYHADESVFVGNNPEEYFDPSKFLTRRSLTEIDDPPDLPALKDSDEEAVTEEDFHAGQQQSEIIDPHFAEPEPVVENAPGEKNLAGERRTEETLAGEALVEESTKPESSASIDTTSTEADSAAAFDAAKKAEINLGLPENERLPDADALPGTEAEKKSSVGINLFASFTFGAPFRQEQARHENPGKKPNENSAISDTHEQAANFPETLSDDGEKESAEITDHQQEIPDTHPEVAGIITDDSATEDSDNSTQVESVDAHDTQMQSAPETLNPDADGGSNWYIEQDNDREDARSPILDWSALDEAASPAELPGDERPDDELPDDAGDESNFSVESDATDSEPKPEVENVSETPPQNEREQRESAIEERPEDSTEAIRARALKTELEDEEALEAIPKENLVVLGEMSTPLELLQSRDSHWPRRIALSFSIILLGALLTAQFLWQRIEVYSQLPQIRPFYEFTCNWLICELPAYSDIGAIRSDNLLVRSHPELANGLMVNITIRNIAEFPQAFPIMVLSFNTASNGIVALREFATAEYLDPGLQSFVNMPVMTPVQIDLEIIDPGPDAVNYTLAFRRP
ncbi:MAG: DUF3426 domain-containing protein [Pseudohongiella sp.]|nr:DUF3426 domain-containing protein [Pseudohongiella sp.]